MDMAGNNVHIVNAIAKTHNMLELYNNPTCSISGGSDSDVMLDMVYRLDVDKKVKYIWFNTGLEYQATKDHLNFLEDKYGINFERVMPIKSIPVCCKDCGQPFLSKITSERIESLQNAGFDFRDEPYEVQIEKYPTVVSRIKWFHGKNIMYQFNCSKRLHRFLVLHPPQFKISAKCCSYSKKKPIKLYQKEHYVDLEMIGVRRAEGGARSVTNNCVTTTGDVTTFRPIYWFDDCDKKAYDEIFGITHSDCYIKYGMKRTGCVGCPFNRFLFDELESIKYFENGLYRAACNVFKDSYEYTRLYRKFEVKT